MITDEDIPGKWDTGSMQEQLAKLAKINKVTGPFLERSDGGYNDRSEGANFAIGEAMALRSEEPSEYALTLFQQWIDDFDCDERFIRENLGPVDLRIFELAYSQSIEYGDR